jgi:hypothetical protein
MCEGFQAGCVAGDTACRPTAAHDAAGGVGLPGPLFNIHPLAAQLLAPATCLLGCCCMTGNV